jgi:hypothetical protein
MKHFIATTTLLLLIGVNSFAQEGEHPALMQSDSTWGKEYFKLPTGFAQEMTLHGIEEAIFPKGWGSVDSPEFWTYIFAWKADASAPITTKVIEDNLTLYFDGLLNISQKDSTVTKLPSTVLLVPTKGLEHFTGKLRIFDRFRTNKMITLNLLAQQYYCEKEQQTVIVFRFSPKNFDHQIWDKVNGVILRKNVCELD